AVAVEDERSALDKCVAGEGADRGQRESAAADFRDAAAGAHDLAAEAGRRAVRADAQTIGVELHRAVAVERADRTFAAAELERRAGRDRELALRGLVAGLEVLLENRPADLGIAGVGVGAGEDDRAV